MCSQYHEADECMFPLKAIMKAGCLGRQTVIQMRCGREREWHRFTLSLNRVDVKPKQNHTCVENALPIKQICRYTEYHAREGHRLIDLGVRFNLLWYYIGDVQLCMCTEMNNGNKRCVLFGMYNILVYRWTTHLKE